MDPIIKKLAQVNIFKGLTEVEVEKLIYNNIHYRTKTIQKDEMILMQGREYKTLYFLLSGKCIGEMTNISGKMIKVEDFTAPDIIAPAIPFAEKPLMPVSLIAKTQVVLAIFPPIEFYRLLQAHATILENFLKEISEKIILLSRRLEFMSFHTIKSKLAQYIIKLSVNNKAKLPFSYEELAQYLGVARPSVYRVFNDLEEHNIIKKDGRNITILDLDRLQDLLE